jgi:hypothetical protein
VISKGLEFENYGIIKLAKRSTSQEAAHDAITRRHPPIPSPSQVEGQTTPAKTFINQG